MVPHRNKQMPQGQSTMEYAVLIIIIMAALIAMQVYIKRGVQGHWKKSVDDLAEQYDPGLVNLSTNYTLVANSDSSIGVGQSAIDPTTGEAGYYTMRFDSTNSVETKQGKTIVAPP